jgi:hypothetical protein
MIELITEQKPNKMSERFFTNVHFEKLKLRMVLLLLLFITSVTPNL